MQTLIALLALAAILLFIVGLIRPRWAFLRARWQVLIAYPAALTVLGIVASALMPPDELAAIRDQAAATAEASAESQPTVQGDGHADANDDTLRATWCAYLDRKQAVIDAIGRTLGRSPHEALQVGDRVILKKPLVIDASDRLPPITPAAETVAHAPEGDTIEVLRRWRKESVAMYDVRWVETGFEGAAMAVALGWLSHEDGAALRHAAQSEAELEASLAPIKTELFGSPEAAWDVQLKALEHNWHTTCD